MPPISSARAGVTLVVAHPQLHAWQRKADRAAATLAVLGVVGVGRQHHGLAHAVALEDGVAGALAPGVEGLDQQRRRARDEHAHRGAGLSRQRRLGEHAHVQRGHAHEHGGVGHLRNAGLGVEAVEPDHLGAGQQRTVAGDEQAVHMEDRQRVDQHIARLPAPPAHAACAHCSAGCRASASRPCCARWCRWCRGCAASSSAALNAGSCSSLCCAARSSRLPLRSSFSVKTFCTPALNANGLSQAKLRPLHTTTRRLGVADEVLDLAGLVGGVQRQVHGTRRAAPPGTASGPRRSSRSAPPRARRPAAPATQAGWRCIALPRSRSRQV